MEEYNDTGAVEKDMSVDGGTGDGKINGLDEVHMSSPESDGDNIVTAEQMAEQIGKNMRTQNVGKSVATPALNKLLKDGIGVVDVATINEADKETLIDATQEVEHPDFIEASQEVPVGLPELTIEQQQAMMDEKMSAFIATTNKREEEIKRLRNRSFNCDKSLNLLGLIMGTVQLKVQLGGTTSFTSETLLDFMPEKLKTIDFPIESALIDVKRSKRPAIERKVIQHFYAAMNFLDQVNAPKEVDAEVEEVVSEQEEV